MKAINCDDWLELLPPYGPGSRNNRQENAQSINPFAYKTKTIAEAEQEINLGKIIARKQIQLLNALIAQGFRRSEAIRLMCAMIKEGDAKQW